MGKNLESKSQFSNYYNNKNYLVNNNEVGLNILNKSNNAIIEPKTNEKRNDIYIIN